MGDGVVERVVGIPGSFQGLKVVFESKISFSLLWYGEETIFALLLDDLASAMRPIDKCEYLSIIFTTSTRFASRTLPWRRGDERR